MYNFCSDNLKKDYEFIKYIILKFKNNAPDDDDIAMLAIDMNK